MPYPSKPLSENKHALGRLKEALIKLAPEDGDFLSPIPALSVHRRSDITEPMPCIYDLGLAITVAGEPAKRFSNTKREKPCSLCGPTRGVPRNLRKP